MPRFCTKPAIVEAFQFTYVPDAHCDWPDWFYAAVYKNNGEIGEVFINPNGYYVIRTVDDILEIRNGYYVIRDAEGFLSCYAPQVFESTYHHFPDYCSSVTFEFYSPFPSSVGTRQVARDPLEDIVKYCSHKSVEKPQCTFDPKGLLCECKSAFGDAQPTCPYYDIIQKRSSLRSDHYALLLRHRISRKRQARSILSPLRLSADDGREYYAVSTEFDVKAAFLHPFSFRACRAETSQRQKPLEVTNRDCTGDRRICWQRSRVLG